ncbi:hypothetical protein HYPSUDRAFT_46725 [Hypholoma sublateritium FD-334 SS-4]|uniref:Uncharacterized protein n=1 Tax=Hypholoma sublateritium (strain FD-334 SS-4) TaxID=945553 RepID=A0A0D2M1S5_HYPSF|nr:hypothetical protein HYPSUDRAFT_46725 [Hypholoma sublateritium FD-334 SS-4]
MHRIWGLHAHLAPNPCRCPDMHMLCGSSLSEYQASPRFSASSSHPFCPHSRLPRHISSAALQSHPCQTRTRAPMYTSPCTLSRPAVRRAISPPHGRRASIQTEQQTHTTLMSVSPLRPLCQHSSPIIRHAAPPPRAHLCSKFRRRGALICTLFEITHTDFYASILKNVIGSLRRGLYAESAILRLRFSSSRGSTIHVIRLNLRSHDRHLQRTYASSPLPRTLTKHHPIARSLVPPPHRHFCLAIHAA